MRTTYNIGITTYTIISIIILACFLAGCSGKSDGNLTATDNKNICEKPYIIFEGDCCLDANSNSICDKNEIEKKPGAELIQGTSVAERCDAGSRLQCVTYTIGLDSVSLKLQSSSKDIINVKKIFLSSLGCSQDFESSAEMKYNDVQQFTIPCKATHTTADSDMIITADVKVVKMKNSGEVDEVGAATESQMKGHLSGVVKI